MDRNALRLALLMVASLLVAGCTSRNEESETPTTTPEATTTPEMTPTPEPSPEPTPTPPTMTPTPVTPTPSTPAPTPPVAFTNISLRHDYANASENLTFNIPANAPALELWFQFDTAPTVVPGQYACTAGLRIKVIRPDGAIHDEVISSAGTGQNVHCGVTRVSTGAAPTDIPPGEWHASFEGAGVGIGWVYLTAEDA